MGPTLNGPFRGDSRFSEFEFHHNGIVWAIVWDLNEAINIRGVIDMWRWSVNLSNSIDHGTGFK